MKSHTAFLGGTDACLKQVHNRPLKTGYIFIFENKLTNSQNEGHNYVDLSTFYVQRE